MPSTLPQRVSIWREDGIVENIEVNQIYFLVEVNHVDKYSFDKELARITPCTPVGFAYRPSNKAFYSLHLHPLYGFTWDREEDGEETEIEGILGIRPMRWNDPDMDHV